MSTWSRDLAGTKGARGTRAKMQAMMFLVRTLVRTVNVLNLQKQCYFREVVILCTRELPFLVLQTLLHRPASWSTVTVYFLAGYARLHARLHDPHGPIQTLFWPCYVCRTDLIKAYACFLVLTRRLWQTRWRHRENPPRPISR